MPEVSPAWVEGSATETAAGRVLLIGQKHELCPPLEEGLRARNCLLYYAAGSADALRRLRLAPYSVVITDPATSVEEDLALLAEMRAIRPGVKAILLTPGSTPEEVIAALRARVFVCKSAPFDADEIAEYAARAAANDDSLLGIEVLSAHRDWVSLRINCQMLTAERLLAFLQELQSDLAQGPREELMIAFREVLMNAIEHGAEFQPGKIVDVAAVHGAFDCLLCARSRSRISLGDTAARSLVKPAGSAHRAHRIARRKRDQAGRLRNPHRPWHRRRVDLQ